MTNKKIQSFKERFIPIESCKYVDKIEVYSAEEDLYLIKIKPDIRILGTDWKNKEFTGHDLDIDIHWHNSEHNYSTSNLRKRVYQAEYEKNNK